MHGLLGFAAPAVVVLACYPVLAARLGGSAFGVYLLASSLSGTVTLFDLGFSAATVKFVAEDLAAGRRKLAAEVIATSLVFCGALGVAGGATIAALGPWLAGFCRIEGSLAGDAATAFRLAGLQFAAFLPGMVFVSIAKAMQQFGRSAMFVSLLAMAGYGSAAAAVLMGAGLVGAMAATAAANIAWLALIGVFGLRLCRARAIELRGAKPAAFRRIVTFGWGLTVNSLSGFLLYQVQKYLVAVTMGPSAVTIYQTAALAPSKLHAAVNAASEALFPFSSASRDPVALRRVYLRMLGGTAFGALAGFLALMTLGRPLLKLWAGAGLAASVSPLVPIFALAYLFLAFSPAPFHLVNGVGRPELNTAFYAGNALLNIALILAFARTGGLTLRNLAWAFALANIFTGICYQAGIEALIWRRVPRLSRFPA
jgi:O-antigen/teichoic acid export membrane protein